MKMKTNTLNCSSSRNICYGFFSGAHSMEYLAFFICRLQTVDRKKWREKFSNWHHKKKRKEERTKFQLKPKNSQFEQKYGDCWKKYLKLKQTNFLIYFSCCRTPNKNAIFCCCSFWNIAHKGEINTILKSN